MCLKVQGKCGVKMLKVWIVIEPDGFSDGKMAGEGETGGTERSRRGEEGWRKEEREERGGNP